MFNGHPAIGLGYNENGTNLRFGVGIISLGSRSSATGDGTIITYYYISGNGFEYYNYTLESESQIFLTDYYDGTSFSPRPGIIVF